MVPFLQFKKREKTHGGVLLLGFRLTVLGLLLTQHILLFELFLENNFCDALRDLIPFVQFKKREKHPPRIITFSNARKYNNTRNIISFSVGKISFIFLMTPIDSTNDQNIVTIERSELTLLLIFS